MCDSFRLHSRKYHVVGVADDDGSGTTSICSINKHPVLSGILNNPLDGSRFRAYDCYNTIGSDNISESDVNQFNLHTDKWIPFPMSKDQGVKLSFLELLE